MQQIAGRAGRKGIFEKGLYSCAGNLDYIRKKINKKPDKIRQAVVGFPESLLNLDAKLSEIIEQWEKIPVKQGYQRMDTRKLRRLTLELEELTGDKYLIYRFVTIPFNPDKAEKIIWDAMVCKELQGEYLSLADADRIYPLKTNNMSLDSMEQVYKICDLLYNYFIRFEHPEDIEELLALKKRLSKQILDELSSHGLKARKCKYCGRTMA